MLLKPVNAAVAEGAVESLPVRSACLVAASAVGEGAAAAATEEVAVAAGVAVVVVAVGFEGRVAAAVPALPFVSLKP